MSEQKSCMFTIFGLKSAFLGKNGVKIRKFQKCTPPDIFEIHVGSIFGPIAFLRKSRHVVCRIRHNRFFNTHIQNILTNHYTLPPTYLPPKTPTFYHSTPKSYFVLMQFCAEYGKAWKKHINMEKHVNNRQYT